MSGFVGLVFIAFVLWCLCSSGSRAATGHFHGGSRRTRAMHEAGHYVAAKAVGGSVAGARVTGSGGYVNARNLPNAKAQIIFQLAGGIAAGTGAGCSDDYASARRALQEYPPGERDRVWRQAQAEAQRIVSSNKREIRQVAEKLHHDGSA